VCFGVEHVSLSDTDTTPTDIITLNHVIFFKFLLVSVCQCIYPCFIDDILSLISHCTILGFCNLYSQELLLRSFVWKYEKCSCNTWDMTCWLVLSSATNVKVRKTQEGGWIVFLKNSSFLLKTEHTDQKLSDTASEVIIRIWMQRNKTEREEERHKAIILVPSTIWK
jgi:hypothetical protein